MRRLFFLFYVLVAGAKIVESAAAPLLVVRPTTAARITTAPPDIITFPVSTAAPISSATPNKPTEPAPPIDPDYTFPYYSRVDWGARAPTDSLDLNLPQVPYVVVHDSGEPPVIEAAGCTNQTTCIRSMKNIQNLHMDTNGWWDIGYHFAIGGDGAVYEGRGWGVMGAQVKSFNSVSLGICFIGSYAGKLTPTLVQTNALTDLIAAGIRLGHIRPDYRLVYHGQIRGTLCPGKKLSKKIMTMSHYSSFPGSLKDLLDIPEIPDDIKAEIRQEMLSGSDAL